MKITTYIIAALLISAPLVSAAPFLGPGDHKLSVEVSGLKRTFLVHAPPSYGAGDPVPVLIAIHGGGGDGRGMQALTQWDRLADSQKFLAIYPDGIGKEFRGKIIGSWNGGRCCPPASEGKVDDAGFIRSMLELLAQSFSIDQTRIYATGHSNGALMAYRLACELSDKIAAIGPMGGQGTFEKCEPSRKVSIMHIHGMKDNCAFFKGGQCGGCFSEYLNTLYGLNVPAFKWPCTPVEEHISEWRRRHNLAAEKNEYKAQNLSCVRYGPGEGGEEVILCAVPELGHAYPGAVPLPCRKGEFWPRCKLFKKIVGESKVDFEPHEVLWEFFKRHHL